MGGGTLTESSTPHRLGNGRRWPGRTSQLRARLARGAARGPDRVADHVALLRVRG